MEVWKMKIVQIENGFVHWDATRDVPDLDWAASHYAPNIIFVEAPDYVFEGWTFDEELEGDERFVQPVAPDGWVYDVETGAFKPEGFEEKPSIDPLSSIAMDVLDMI